MNTFNFLPDKLCHKNNLDQKLAIAGTPALRARVEEMEALYEKHIAGIDYEEVAAGSTSSAVASLEVYLTAAKRLEKVNAMFNWRSNFAASIIPEFIYRSLHVTLARDELAPEFSTRRSVVEFTPSGTKAGGWNIRRKDQDLAIGLQTSKVPTDGETESFLVPLVAMEVKTNIDKNKLNGLDFSAERLKRTFPNSKYFLVTETIDFSLKHSYAAGAIDEVYVLRRQIRSEARRKGLQPLRHEVFEQLFADVKRLFQRASATRKDVYARLPDGRLIHGI